MENTKTRQSNFELLRIIAMMMIIGLHYFNGTMGGALNHSIGYNYYLTHLFESLFIVGVNCFVLITGYFMIGKSEININKIIKLMISLIFYSLIFYGISIVIGQNHFSFKEIVFAIIPFVAGRRWFVEAYIILFLLIPFLNVALTSISIKKYRILLAIMLVFFSLWCSFLPYPPETDNGYGIINFVFLYCIGGYIKLYWKNIKAAKIYAFGYMLCALFTFISSLIPHLQNRAWGYSYIFNIIGAVFLFLAFSKLKIKSKVINLISPYMFGVFIIHSDSSLTNFIYQDLGRCFEFWNSPYLIIHIFIFISITLIVCVAIDMIKEKVFKNTLFRFIDKFKIFNLKI